MYYQVFNMKWSLRKIILISIVALLLIITLYSATAADVKINVSVSEDVRVSSGGGMFDSTQSIQISNYDIGLNGLLLFDLSAYPVISEAILYFYAGSRSSVDSPGMTLSIYNHTNITWDEGDSLFSILPGLDTLLNQTSGIWITTKYYKFNVTGILAATKTTFFINASGATGIGYINWRSREFGSSTIAKLEISYSDTESPTYSNNFSFPTTPANYTTSSPHFFNVTWTDPGVLSDAIFSFDGTNYSMKNNGDEYYANQTNLTVGTYSYYFWANDTSDNKNSTGAISFVVQKGLSGATVYLNNSNSNVTIAQGSSVWLNGTATSKEGDLKLYNNGTLINTGSTPIFNFTQFNITGLHNITVTYATTENYSVGFQTYWINLTNIAPTFDEDLVTQTLNHNENLNYDVNCSDYNPDVVIYYVNDTLVDINSSTGNVSDNPIQSDEGSYEIKVTCGDGTDNTSQTFTYNIGNAPPSVASAAINDSSPLTTDFMECLNGSVSDNEGDSVSFIYDWEKDAVWLGINDNVLNPGNTSNDENWRCRLTPNDGLENGTTKISASVEIGSPAGAPSITVYNATTTTTNINSSVANPTNNNSWINFSTSFTDSDTNEWTAYFCNSTSVSAAGCGDFTYCNSTINSTSKTLNCKYDIESLSDSTYTYYTVVVDNSSLVSAAISNTFNVNHPPSIPTIVSPSNNTFFNAASKVINYTAVDSDSDVLNYTIYNSTDGITFNLVNSTTQSFFTWSSLTEGTYYTKTQSIDLHGYTLSQNSSIYQFTIDTTTPLLTITAPTNNFEGDEASVILTLDATDTNLNLCNYTLLFKDTQTVSSTGVANCQGSVVVPAPFRDAGYTLNVTAYDKAGNLNDTSVNFTTTADVVGGGGGGSAPDVTEEFEELLEQALICGNGICQEGESPWSCPVDCPIDFSQIICPLTSGTNCPAWVFTWLLYLIGGVIVYIMLKKGGVKLPF